MSGRPGIVRVLRCASIVAAIDVIAVVGALGVIGMVGCLHRSVGAREERALPVPEVPSSPLPETPTASPVVRPDPLGLPCDVVMRLEVRKRERTLTAYCAGGGLRLFPIGLSREPTGAKRRRGDQRIPEGDYAIWGHARAGRFHLFLPIDYPSVADADRARQAGVISEAVRLRILAAHAAGRLPPQDTALGGLVGFHGEGERWRGDLDLDWTEGCIALRDEAIRWLAQHAPPGTAVSIQP